MTDASPLTFGSLFAGIGGFDLGLERAGMKCVWQVEIDPFCRKVLKKHWPDIRRKKDVNDFPPEPIDDWKCDVVCGGFPCQPVSVAGNQKGREDERWLWPQYQKVLSVLRPRYVIVENVPGLIDTGTIADVLGGLAVLGYDAEWEMLSAASFGAPHERERTFIVGYTRKVGRECSVFPYGRDAIHTKRIWKATKDFRKWSEWERWLRSNCPDHNGKENGSWLSGVDDGVSTRLDKDRIAALGNAVVPQIAKWIGQLVVEFDKR